MFGVQSLSKIADSFDLCHAATKKMETQMALRCFKANAKDLCWDQKDLLFPNASLTKAFVSLSTEHQNALVDFFQLKPLSVTPQKLIKCDECIQKTESHLKGNNISPIEFYLTATWMGGKAETMRKQFLLAKDLKRTHAKEIKARGKEIASIMLKPPVTLTNG
ncbi:MAG: hypothetical protein FWF24_04550 [Alphaproteobacteria bacterium]|nr:hypothetical protein [Alphaproteobacteria bacterium]